MEDPSMRNLSVFVHNLQAPSCRTKWQTIMCVSILTCNKSDRRPHWWTSSESYPSAMRSAMKEKLPAASESAWLAQHRFLVRSLRWARGLVCMHWYSVIFCLKLWVSRCFSLIAVFPCHVPTPLCLFQLFPLRSKGKGRKRGKEKRKGN